MTIQQLYDLSHTRANTLLSECEYPWQALDKIGDAVLSLGKDLDPTLYEEKSEHVWVAKSAVIYPGVTLIGPCIIGEKTEVRPGAFIRGKVLVGDGCVVGNSTELKNCILFDGVQVPHFNYVGDSILGYKSHLGAGAVTSNVKSDKTPVTVRTADGKLETGRKKFGAAVGDHTEVGCNSVLCPGTVLGKNCTVYPLSRVRGFIPEAHIFKSEKDILPKR